MARRPQVDTFEAAAKRGAYDECPVLPLDKDPQLCLSRNDRQQPFFLICQHDCLLAQLSGEGRIAFQGASVLNFDMRPGDFVYIPAGVPHRYTPATPSIQYRYKAQKAGLEAVAWYCPQCNAELHRDVWDTARELPQEGYLRATSAFRDDEGLRRCRQCGTIHAPPDVSGSRWAEVAAELRAETGTAPLPPTSSTLAIAPHPTKQPLRENVYWVGRMANAQLVPMFPYLEPGSIVPCISLFYGGPDSVVGHFVHANSVDEVLVNFGAVESYIKPGLARVGTKVHGVGTHSAKPEPDGFAAINVITQRHPTDAGQRETVTFICHSCKHELTKHEYDGNPAASSDSEFFAPGLPTLATIIESSRTAEDYNALGDDIVCPKCGAHNERFPMRIWGWSEYRRKTQGTVRSMRALALASKAGS
jgi:rubredoxin